MTYAEWNSFGRKDHAGLTWVLLKGPGVEAGETPGQPACGWPGRPARSLSGPVAIEENKGFFYGFLFFGFFF